MSRHPDRQIRSDLALNVSFNRGDASDRSMFNNTPTLFGNAAVSGRVLNVDGTGDYVRYPDAEHLSFTNGAGQDLPFSVSYWVNPSSVANAYRAGVAKTAGSSGNYEWATYVSRNDAGAKGPALVILNPTASAFLVRGKVTNSMAINTWYHLVFTYSGSETHAGMKIYQNAAMVDDFSASTGSYTGMSNTTQPASIGALGDGAQGTIGSIDDVRIYKRELTAAEVGAIYASGRD
jgi:hypothetical protein